MSEDRLAQADQATGSEGPSTYEPPTLTVVGSIEELTTGDMTQISPPA